MSWKIRHEGSPKFVEGLSPEQILDGLQNGRWEPTDEVMGPREATWTPLEAHPVFAEVAAELEPPPPRTYDDETRLDMNALIDVALVLLIFFILTITYNTLQLHFDSKADAEEAAKKRQEGKDKVRQTPFNLNTMVVVDVAVGPDGKPAIKVQGKPTAQEEVKKVLREHVSDFGRRVLVIRHDDKIDYGTVLRIQDEGVSVGILQTIYAVPQKKEP